METSNNESDLFFSDEFYCSIMDKDKVTDKWLLMSSPLPITVIITTYLLIVLKLGPWYMKDKEPYSLKTIMRLYNIVQVIYNAACLYIFLTPRHGVKIPILFLIQHSCSDPRQVYLVDENIRSLFLNVCWYILGLKLLDLLDTGFMVLRKKYSHISFLHVYHHAGTVFLVWYSIKYIKAVQGAIPVFINLIVHFVMYGYYFLATFKSMKKYLGWKRHLTKLQLLQMVVILGYLSALYYNQCPISKRFTYIWLFNVAANFLLFSNFYVQSYTLSQKQDKKTQ